MMFDKENMTTEGVVTENTLLSFDASDVGNAEAVKHLHGARILHTEAMGFLTHTGTHWQAQDARHDVRRMVIDTLRQRGAMAFMASAEGQTHDEIVKKSRLSRANIQNAIGELEAMVNVPLKSFDSESHLLNCQNGVIDLRTGELSEHSPDQRFTYCINAPYDSTIGYGAWHTWITESVGTAEMASYLQRAVGYSFTGETSEECLFFLYGKPRAGKGTLTETLQSLMGNIGRTVGLRALTHRSEQGFELAPLRNSRSVFCSEAEKRNALSAARVKELTGGDSISCSFKGKDHFEYRPMYKIWVSSNWQVNSDVDDDGVWTRLKVIPFVQSFIGNPDPALKQRMKSPENLIRVLAWAVDGAKQWYASGLQEPQAVKDTVNQHRDDLDYIGKFLDDATTNDPDGYVSRSLLYSMYKTWADDEGATIAGVRAFKTALGKKGYGATHKKVSGKTQRVYTGLNLI